MKVKEQFKRGRPDVVSNVTDEENMRCQLPVMDGTR